MTVDPPAVTRFAAALADWLASYTVPSELGAEMADVCAAGSAWAAAVGGTAVRRTGWTDTEALTWGISVGALAGALEGIRKSLLPGAGSTAKVDGPARPLLAADGLVAAAHEALAALAPARLRVSMAALSHAFGHGGAWRRLSPRWPQPAWATLVPLALQPAAAADPAGPWADTAAAWSGTYGASGAGRAAEPAGIEPDARLWRHAAADAGTSELLHAAARAAASAAREIRAGA